MRMPKILVVDDKPNVCEFVATILARYDVETASNGAEALSAIAAAEYDVIVSDVCMPGANGHEVLVAARARSPRTRIVLMTGYATVADAVAAMKHGACEYIEKPFDADDVLLAVAQALESANGACAGAWANATGDRERVGTTMPYRRAMESARVVASKLYLAALLDEFDGNVTRAAERAGMERENLHRLLRRFGLHACDFRHSDEEPSPIAPAH